MTAKPNDRHIETILKQLGMENCKPSPVPERKLDLTQSKELDEKDKATFASCVGLVIYLSQDRDDVKFAVKELARQTRAPRMCRQFENFGSIPPRYQEPRSHDKDR